MTVESTIGTGQDYGTPALWWASISADPTEAERGTCMVDETYTGILLLRLSNANAVQLTLAVDPSVRHNFKQNTGARQEKGAGDSNPVIYVDCPNVRIENFSAICTSSAPGSAIAQNSFGADDFNGFHAVDDANGVGRQDRHEILCINGLPSHLNFRSICQYLTQAYPAQSLCIGDGNLNL